MFNPEFLLDGWEDNVRALCGGVTDTMVSDALLALDPYGPSSEDFLKKIITNWASLEATYPSEFNRAAYYHVALKICSFLKTKMLASERIGSDYSYTMQKIDWDKLAAELMAVVYENIGLIDADLVGTLNIIEISQRVPSVYEGLIVEEAI